MLHFFLPLFAAITFSGTALANEQEALNHIKKLGKSLKSELQKALAKSPIDAVKVCQMKAPALAKAASNKGIVLGRVSRRNRNPENTPKSWMLPTIKAYHEGKITTAYTKTEVDKDHDGLILPIRTQGLCLACHGKTVAPELSKKIRELYPQDKATGYELGEIRGFFWAKFPKSKS